jgi:hypothetical protein
MKCLLDFQLIVPGEALPIKDSELLPSVKDFLRSSGIIDSSGYDHYLIRMIIKPINNNDSLPSLFDVFSSKSRKQKKVSFASADSLFITMVVGHDEIILREVFPPTTYSDGRRDGQMELLVHGNAGLSSNVPLTGAKATAELQAYFKKQFGDRRIAIKKGNNNKSAFWDFRRPWILDNNQPEIYITCSVKKDLPEKDRFVRCQRRVSQKGRAILAPKRSKKIVLPMPIST